MTVIQRTSSGGGGASLPAGGEKGEPLVNEGSEKGEWSKKITGGEAAKGFLTLEGTSNAVKGGILFGSKGVWLEEEGAKGETAPKLGIGLTAPTSFFQLEPGTAGQPKEVATTPGTEAAKTILVKGATGGNTSIATTGTGGIGSGLVIESGAGGLAESAKTSATGGAAGLIQIKTGAGASTSAANTETGKGGNAGEFQFSTGLGGKGLGSVAGTGGKSGVIKVVTSPGGEGTTTGGASGEVKFETGKGGLGGTTGGASGQIALFTGAAGATNAASGSILIACGASTGTGKAGNIELTAGKGNEAEKGGALIFKTEGTERMKITTAGAVEHAKGIGVFGHAAPAAQPAEIVPAAITVKELMEKLNTLHKEYGITA